MKPNNDKHPDFKTLSKACLPIYNKMRWYQEVFDSLRFNEFAVYTRGVCESEIEKCENEIIKILQGFYIGDEW